ncbi:MAG: DUF2505 domain-containing protein [Oceanococcaceae bacterium]
MAISFDDVQSFPIPAERVMAMFTDRAYFERKYAELANSFTIQEHRHDEAEFFIKALIHYDFDAPVPGFAKKILPGELTVTQSDRWDVAQRKGVLEVSISGAPVTMRADMTLVETAQGCENRMRWTITCGVPLIGGKLEKLIRDDVQSKAPRDLEVSREIAKEY